MSPALPFNGHAPRILIVALLFTVIQFGLGALSYREIAGTFAVGILLAVILASLCRQLPFRPGARLVILWFALFVVQMFSNLLEGLFFTTRIPTAAHFAGAAGIGLLITLAEAGSAVFLFPAEGDSVRFRDRWRECLQQWPRSTWLWRIGLASALYLPIYYTFGSLVSPVVMPYYTATDSGFGLTVPAVEVILLLELLHGLLYVGAVLPLIAALAVGKKRLFLTLVPFLFVAGAAAPVLVSEALPPLLRVVHGLEIFADVVVFSAVIALLLGKSMTEEKGDGSGDW